MSSNTNNVKGVLYPTAQGLLAGNPRDSAIKELYDTANKSAKLNNAIGGTIKRRKCGGTGRIVIPQYTNMLYTPTNGPTEHPNNQIVDINKISTQALANSKYDHFAKISGGKKNRMRKKGTRKKGTKRKTKRVSGGKKTKKQKKGGKFSNPDWNWKCYS